MANRTHPIKQVNIAVAATPQNIAADLGLSSLAACCSWFGIQNKDAGSIYLQESLTATAAQSIEIASGQMYRPGSVIGSAESFDFTEYWVRSVNANAKYVIEWKKA